MKIRYIIETKTETDCPECTGTSRAHTRFEYKHTLPDGTPLDELRPGDVYFSEAHDAGPDAAKSYGCPWTNCDGRHLFCLVPDKDRTWHGWDIDGRARNCDMKEETTHRCWVRHGSPEDGTIHVDKAGFTCKAGAGSIGTNNWHGFLHHGDLHT